jgi:hypothetical protein
MAGSKRPRVCKDYSKPPYRVFWRRLILKNTPPRDLAAPPIATVLVASFVALPPFGRLEDRVEVSMLVDVKRAPYPGDASRVSAASSNTLNPPVIRPYPPLYHTLLKIQAPPPKLSLRIKHRCIHGIMMRLPHHPHQCVYELVLNLINASTN